MSNPSESWLGFVQKICITISYQPSHLAYDGYDHEYHVLPKRRE
jgi:hypothetical protein